MPLGCSIFLNQSVVSFYQLKPQQTHKGYPIFDQPGGKRPLEIRKTLSLDEEASNSVSLYNKTFFIYQCELYVALLSCSIVQ